ncbi:hypothetical protein [Alicyclobacillus sp. ALC3]|uniref:hypothetical protein n=1 Tax=Alicyclobacillus sp. ALC3 TaxID=2796143 RepID=UPI002378C8A2|nr:hypothetical protein [Alicyclobacillus sp. ALC3]WDL96614.1 hypothetical protein JC200_20255 [Alicyclobacillus sp. ALC3]
MSTQTYVETVLWGMIAWGTLYFLHQMLPHATIKGIQQAVFPAHKQDTQPSKLVSETNGQ